MSKSASPQYSRSYSPQTLKILFGMSGNECAEPACSNPAILDATDFDEAAVSAQIAHIFAVSDNGPRGKPGLTQQERNHHKNLLLLCPTHHGGVDTQHNTYPAELLTRWKSNHERKFGKKMAAKITDVGYAELEVAAKAVMASGGGILVGAAPPLPPQAKLEKNQLSEGIAFLLKVGAAKSQEVEDVIKNSAQLDASFPLRLKNGFKEKYNSFLQQGLNGDDLFQTLYFWAGGGNSDPIRQAAGLCLLTHLFIICDVFES